MNTTQAMPSTSTPNLDAFAEELPTIQVTRRKALPTGIATNVKQQVLLIRDHSSSMSGIKIEELNKASQALISSLAEPDNKDGFRVSIIDFNHKAKRACVSVAPGKLSVPEISATGGTNFNTALETTISLIKDLKSLPNNEGWHYLQPCVLFLSDGQSQLDPAIVQELHELAQVTAIAYGSDASEKTLASISSDHQVHVVGVDGHQLRQFFANVGKTLSQALQQNQ